MMRGFQLLVYKLLKCQNETELKDDFSENHQWLLLAEKQNKTKQKTTLLNMGKSLVGIESSTTFLSPFKAS